MKLRLRDSGRSLQSFLQENYILCKPFKTRSESDIYNSRWCWMKSNKRFEARFARVMCCDCQYIGDLGKKSSKLSLNLLQSLLERKPFRSLYKYRSIGHCSGISPDKMWTIWERCPHQSSPHDKMGIQTHAIKSLRIHAHRCLKTRDYISSSCYLVLSLNPCI